jgi:hypothetical protein
LLRGMERLSGRAKPHSLNRNTALGIGYSLMPLVYCRASRAGRLLIQLAFRSEMIKNAGRSFGQGHAPPVSFPHGLRTIESVRCC